MTYGGCITYSKGFTLLLGIIIITLFLLEEERIGVAEKKGFKRLMSADDIIKGVHGGIMVSVKKLKENPDQIKTVIRGTLKTLAYIKENRKEAIDFNFYNFLCL